MQHLLHADGFRLAVYRMLHAIRLRATELLETADTLLSGGGGGGGSGGGNNGNGVRNNERKMRTGRRYEDSRGDNEGSEHTERSREANEGDVSIEGGRGDGMTRGSGSDGKGDTGGGGAVSPPLDLIYPDDIVVRAAAALETLVESGRLPEFQDSLIAVTRL